MGWEKNRYISKYSLCLQYIAYNFQIVWFFIELHDISYRTEKHFGFCFYLAKNIGYKNVYELHFVYIFENIHL